MGRTIIEILKWISLSIMVIILISFVIIYQWRENKLERDYVLDIYLKTSATKLEYLLGIMPHCENYQDVLLEKGKDYRLRTIRGFVVLLADGKYSYIKPNIKEIGGNDTLLKDCEQEILLKINLEEFNRYIHLSNISDSNLVKNKLVNFISDPTDINSFKKINRNEDIDSILVKYVLSEEDMKWVYSLINVDTFKLESNYDYYWTNNYGLLSFKFRIDDSLIKSFQVKCIGFPLKKNIESNE